MELGILPDRSSAKKQKKNLWTLGVKRLMLERIEEKLEHDQRLTIADVTWLCKELRETRGNLHDLAVAAGVALTGLRRFATHFTGTIVLQEALERYKRSCGKCTTDQT
jgi:hypothetical protein